MSGRKEKPRLSNKENRFSSITCPELNISSHEESPDSDFEDPRIFARKVKLIIRKNRDKQARKKLNGIIGAHSPFQDVTTQISEKERINKNIQAETKKSTSRKRKLLGSEELNASDQTLEISSADELFIDVPVKKRKKHLEKRTSRKQKNVNRDIHKNNSKRVKHNLKNNNAKYLKLQELEATIPEKPFLYESAELKNAGHFNCQPTDYIENNSEIALSDEQLDLHLEEKIQLNEDCINRDAESKLKQLKVLIGIDFLYRTSIWIYNNITKVMPNLKNLFNGNTKV